nr:hypothetical protein [Tanacetum cinerariifolium]
CGRQILHPNPLQTIIKGVANIIERPVAEFVKFINPHQSVFLVLVLVDKSSRVRISRICFTSLQIGTVRVGLRKVEPLLVAFNSQLKIIMANVPPNDPNVDAPTIVPALVNLDHVPAQPVSLGDGFAPHWIRNNIPNNQNGWIEEDAEEEEEDSEEDPEEEPEDDDDDMEMDDEAEVIDPYMDDGSNNPPPPNSKDKETPLTSPKKFKEQDRHFLGLGCDNIKTDRTVRNVMSDLSRVKKLVKG